MNHTNIQSSQRQKSLHKNSTSSTLNQTYLQLMKWSLGKKNKKGMLFLLRSHYSGPPPGTRIAMLLPLSSICSSFVIRCPSGVISLFIPPSKPPDTLQFANPQNVQIQSQRTTAKVKSSAHFCVLI
jgi:hypothetical protein